MAISIDGGRNKRELSERKPLLDASIYHTLIQTCEYVIAERANAERNYKLWVNVSTFDAKVCLDVCRGVIHNICHQSMQFQ